MAEEPEPEHGTDSAAHSVEMLKAVIDGATYDTVAAQFGVTRTAVERRIKVSARATHPRIIASTTRRDWVANGVATVLLSAPQAAWAAWSARP